MQSRTGSKVSAPPKNPPKEKHLLTEVASIVVFALSIFALVALLTYNAADPSFMSNSHGAPQNACGRIGGCFRPHCYSGLEWDPS